MLKAGFAKLDVTPPLGTELTGYFNVRISDGILDPIYLNAVAIGNDENTVLIITADFMYIREQSVTQYRTLIEKCTGLNKDNILIHTVHQHTSTTAGAEGPTDAAYKDLLSRKFCDVAQLAISDMDEAVASYAEGETAEEISFVRRFKMKDGSIRTNPGRMNPDIVHPIGEADNTVRFVKFERKGKKDIALVNFQTHPDVISGNKFSADWPGFVRTFTEKALDVNCILVNGCQGDVNHIDVSTPPFDKRDTVRRYLQSQHMGQVVTDVVVSLWNDTKLIKGDKVTCQLKFAHLPSNVDGIDQIDEMTAFYSAYVAGKEEKRTMADIGRARRIAGMIHTKLVQNVPVTVLSFGDVAIVGYAGEPFTEYAVLPRNSVPELHVMTACLANGSQGYLPSSDAFKEGGYEASSCEFTSIVAPKLQGIAIEMLENIRNGKVASLNNEKTVDVQ